MVSENVLFSLLFYGHPCIWNTDKSLKTENKPTVFLKTQATSQKIIGIVKLLRKKKKDGKKC